MIFTIDANVFVSDLMSSDAKHVPSRAFMDAQRSIAPTVWCPTIVLVEVAAAIARPSGDAALAQQGVSVVRAFPGIRFCGLPEARAEAAARIAATHRPRGADAIYAAVASESGATLITWDAEMLARAPAVVATVTPSAWLAANPPVP